MEVIRELHNSKGNLFLTSACSTYRNEIPFTTSSLEKLVNKTQNSFVLPNATDPTPYCRAMVLEPGYMSKTRSHLTNPYVIMIDINVIQVVLNLLLESDICKERYFIEFRTANLGIKRYTLYIVYYFQNIRNCLKVPFRTK